MNILLWAPQILLAIHTLMGAIWKFSNSEQAVPSLAAIPHAVWMALIVIELICSLCLVLPAPKKSLAVVVPAAAICIAAEMLLFIGVHLVSGDPISGQMIYWLVVAGLCGFIAYGRLALKPMAG